MIKLRRADRHVKRDYPDAIAIITIGSHEAQLNQKDIEKLHKLLKNYLLWKNPSFIKISFQATNVGGMKSKRSARDELSKPWKFDTGYNASKTT